MHGIVAGIPADSALARNSGGVKTSPGHKSNRSTVTEETCVEDCTTATHTVNARHRVVETVQRAR